MADFRAIREAETDVPVLRERCAPCRALPHVGVGLDGHDLSTMSMLAALLGDLLARSSTLSRKRDLVQQRVAGAVRGEGLRIALQPIIETSTGRLIGAERPSVSHALARLSRAGAVTGQGDEWHLHERLRDQLPQMREPLGSHAERLAVAVSSIGRAAPFSQPFWPPWGL